MSAFIKHFHVFHKERVKDEYFKIRMTQGIEILLNSKCKKGTYVFEKSYYEIFFEEKKNKLDLSADEIKDNIINKLKGG